MLRSLRYLEGYTVSATDAELGKVVNVLFDDEHWAVRYLVVDTGGLLKADGYFSRLHPFVRSTGPPAAFTST